jgi:putative ABC transport system permease protein
MIKNYLKIALRTMWRDRTFSFINLIGLAVGLASVLMIVAYVRYELSYDKHYTNAPNVYRVVMVNKINQVDEGRVYVPTALAQVLQKEFPAVKASTVLVSVEVILNVSRR